MSRATKNFIGVPTQEAVIRTAKRVGAAGVGFLGARYSVNKFPKLRGTAMLGLTLGLAAVAHSAIEDESAVGEFAKDAILGFGIHQAGELFNKVGQTIVGGSKAEGLKGTLKEEARNMLLAYAVPSAAGLGAPEYVWEEKPASFLASPSLSPMEVALM